MELNFTFATGSWIIGVALHNACGGLYKEVDAGQTLIVKRISISRDKLNSEIAKVPLVTDSKTTKVREGFQVIELIDTPTGDKFKMDEAGWKDFTDWLKSHDGFEVVHETKEEIELIDNATVYVR